MFRSACRRWWQSQLRGHWHTRSAANKFVEGNALTSLQLVFLPYLCLLSLLNLITAYLDSPFIPGDVDNVKVDEWPLPWHSYVRWWCSYLPCSEWSQCLVPITFGIAGRGWGASAISCKAAESAFRCSQGISSVSVFLSCAVVGALIFCHSPFSSPQHHLQPLLPRVLCFPSTPSFVDPVAVIISTPMDSSTSSHLSSKPQYPKILVTIVPNSVWLLRMAKRLPSKHATSCYMRPMRRLIITASLASAGSRRFRIHVFFRDQGGRILVPTASIQWFDRRHHAYIWPRRMSSTLPTFVLSTLTTKCIFPEYSLDGKLCSCWPLFDCHVQVRDAQTGQLVCKFSASLVDGIALSPTFMKHYVSLMSKLVIWIVGTGYANMAFIRDGTKLANYSPHFGLSTWDIADLTDEHWHSTHGHELILKSTRGGWVGTMSRCF